MEVNSDIKIEEILKIYSAKVINTCYSFTHNRQDAEDVAQEVFIEVWKSIDKFRGDSKISTWLYRIAVNRSIDFIRKKKRRGYDHDITENEFRLSTESNPHLSLEEREMGLIMINKLDSLPEMQKKAFVLAKFDNKSYAEISEIIGKSISSVESLIFRANKTLREEIDKIMK